jgi:hypothetical protein
MLTMQMQYFGDSYDIVKQSLLRWLKVFGEWSVHPMFTEDVNPADISAFESLLSAKLVSTERLTSHTDRQRYFSCGASCGNLFLDPDKGLRTKNNQPRRAEYLYATELIEMVLHRPRTLTLVFDQSVGRGSEELHLAAKIEHLRDRGVSAFAYCSHACFVVATSDSQLIGEAKEHIIRESRLPVSRFV